MGRLGREKRFDLLIEAFGQVAAGYPDWSLQIWGEGSERACLEAQAASAGLVTRIRLPGRTAAAYQVMRQSDLFVLASHYEGFPDGAQIN